ncbi:hypothetical protein [Croceimicrobium hydrocarbonivorans]|uniref:DUF4252 domain-containing protein n=1 Tax=Croceimicrobium hydrocarbonivorans TaxID=2761580 RepID=A0A7H0VEE7_9FLAO|nr:hypothetical protein [Croceimicrobium hydrocarbonivorans]QNR24095.1 hypothetical protein H4K34_17255 [Croceimicrobium hydrocarbonivorans]
MKNLSLIKLILSFSISLLAFNFSHAQSDAQAVKDGFNKYQVLLQEKKFNEAMTYIYPELFTLVPKEQLLKILNQTFSNPMLEVKMGESKVTKTGQVQEINGKKYMIITYKGVTQMKPGGNAEQQALLKDRMQAGFNEQFGAENVTYNESTGFFTIHMEKEAVAISTDAKNWTYLSIEAQQKLMIEKILPAEIVAQVF